MDKKDLRVRTKEKKSDTNVLLDMVCEDEGLSDAQLTAMRKQDEEFKRVSQLLDKLHQTHNTVEKGQCVYGLVPKEINSAPANSPAVKPILPNSLPTVPDLARIAQQFPSNTTPIPMPPLILQNQPSAAVRPVGSSPNTYQLVMDPRLGLIVGAVSSSQTIPGNPIIQGTTTMAKSSQLGNSNIPGSIVMQSPTIVVNSEQGVSTPMIQRVVKVTTAGNPPKILSTPSRTRMPIISCGTQPTSTVQIMKTAPMPPSGFANRMPFTQVVSSPYAAPRAAIPSNVVAGPSVGSIAATDANRPAVPATSDENRAQPAEVQPVKNNGKLVYPSLMVMVKPSLQAKEYTTSVCTKMRAELDKELKKVLLLAPNELTEWLIQQGLIRAEQKCHTHLDSNYQPVPFKLGIYSDSSKFPNSGGYVWVSDCCGQRHLSVFSGSIFEGVPHTPKTILKLIYHWACQTSPSNIVQWVQVDMNYIKSFNSSMRAVCIAAVNEKLKDIGGEKREIEVAIMTLGTSSNDGKLKQVKVEILGVLDLEKHMVRLCAVEPIKKSVGTPTAVKRDYRQILAPLSLWVDKKSTIVTDLSIDQSCLNDLGFRNIRQISTARGDPNLKIVDYLSTSIPRNFQNVLPMLNRALIQQFLDEISWRETFGPSPLQAFKNFVIHMSEITKIESDQTLMAILNRISSEPFHNWEYKNICKKQPKAVVVPNTPAPIINLIPVSPNVENEAPLSMIDRLPQSIRQVDPPPKRIRKRVSGPERSESPQNASPPQPKKSRQQTVLQEYYYGRMKGRSKEDLERDEAEWRANPANSSCIEFQCCVCRRKFSNNLLFMRHLMKHTQNKGLVDAADDTPVCKYCLKTFVTPYILEAHVKDTHIVRKGHLACRICNLEFFTTVKLIEHMHSTHVELELPYSCKVCGLRSSMHRDVVDHFHEVHEGSRKLQCPFCLQVVTLSGSGKLAMHNVFLFFQHIQKHFIQPPSLKCEKCILRFATKGNVTEHLLRDHTSCKGKPGLTRLQFKGESIIMPVPESSPQVTAPVPTPPPPPAPAPVPKPVTPESNILTPSNRIPAPSSVVNAKLKINRNPKTSLLNHVEFSSMAGVSQEEVKINKSIPTFYKCAECKEEIQQEKHYMSNIICPHCRYMTCCSKAMKAHIADFHSVGEKCGGWLPSSNVVKVEGEHKWQMPTPMYCICGFRSSSGDVLAKHLVQSERRTAYTHLDASRALETQSASFPPLVSLDDPVDQDPSDQMMKAYAERMAQSSVSSPSPGNVLPAKSSGEPQSMLNILGLVRKPSTDESSNDVPDIDDKGEFKMKVSKRNKSPSKGKRARR